MTTEKAILQREPIAYVKVIKLSFQNYAEIDPDFIASYYDDVNERWVIWNETGKYHFIKFNKDYVNPLIIKGWEQIKDFYKLPDNVVIILSFQGPCLFKLKSFKLIDPLNILDSFHSRSTNPTSTFFFDMTIYEETIKSEEITLPDELGIYVKDNCILEFIRLCGDNGETMEFDVVNINEFVLLTTKSGMGWNIFCSKNNIKAGDNIRFKFSINDPMDKCNVYKLH